MSWNPISFIETFLKENKLSAGDIRPATVTINMNGKLLQPREVLFFVRIFSQHFTLLMYTEEKIRFLPQTFDSSSNTFHVEQNGVLSFVRISEEVSYKVVLSPKLSN